MEKLYKIAASLLILILIIGFLPTPIFAATTTIRQEINITDGEAMTSTGTLESQARVLLDPNLYSGSATYYFEAVYSGSAGNTGTIKLSRSGTSTYDASVAGATSSSTILTRSASYTPPTVQTEYTVTLVGDGTHSQTLKSARIVIIQTDTNMTSTETQIEVGNAETAKSNTTSAALNAPKYWKYNSANWSGNPSFIIEATYKSNPVSTTQTFTTTGSSTWQPPTGVTSVDLEAWGGGGAGGDAVTSNPETTGGGGGGAYAKSTLTPLCACAYNYTVGAGGTSASVNGGTTNFNGNTVVAAGGTGVAQNADAGGAGGLTGSSIGSFAVFAGGTGASATGTTSSGGGGGSGGSTTGNNGSGVSGATAVTGGGPGGASTSSNANGSAPASGPGGGGGGGRRTTGSTKTGGSGFAGQLNLTYNLPYAVTLTLQESDGTGDGFTGWADKVTMSNASSTISRVRSANFTPTNGRNYRLVSSIANASGSYDIYDAKIIIQTNRFVAIGAGANSWDGIAVDSSNHNVYAVVNGGDIYKQTAGTGSFTALGQTTRQWTGISIDSSNHNVYASAYNSDIYKQTAGSGSFVALGAGGATGRWENVSVDSTNHNVYANGFIDDIYKQTAGSGSFVALGAGANGWQGIAIDSSNHNVYAIDYSNGKIYKQTAGSGSFVVLGQSGSWVYVAVDSSNQNVYLSVTNTGDIYEQIGGGAAVVTNLEPQYLLANTSLVAGTSLQNFLTKWNSAEWSGTNNTYSFAASAANNSTSVLELDTSGGTQVVGSVVTSPDNQGGSSSLTMPTSQNLDVKATTNNNDIYGSRILVQVAPFPTFNQSATRAFNNASSTDVGSPLAAQDTAATLPSTGAIFRLRSLIRNTGSTLSTSGQSLKLQFAAKTGSCDTAFSGETYADVTSVSAIAFNDNAAVANGVALTANANDPIYGSDTINSQTYVESNNFTNSQSSIAASQDGKWDFSLYDHGLVPSTSYCFRIVKSDGSLLDTYTQIPEIITAVYINRGGGGSNIESSATPNAQQTGGGSSGGSNIDTSTTPGSGQSGGSKGSGSGDLGFMFMAPRFAFMDHIGITSLAHFLFHSLTG